MAKVNLWPKSVRQQFLTVLSETGNVSESLRVVGRTNPSAYWLRRKDAEFSAAWDEAIEIAAGKLEDEARRRAVEGYDEPVFQRGTLVGYTRRYSDRLLETLLRAYRPDRFRTGSDYAVIDNTTLVIDTGIHRELEPDSDAEEVDYRELEGRKLPNAGRSEGE